MAFADDLKYMCMDVFNLTYNQCFDEKEKFKPFEENKSVFTFWRKPAKKPILLTPSHMNHIMLWIEKNGFELTTTQKYQLGAFGWKGITFETPRHILQYIGTEICRDIVSENYHAIVLKRNIDKDPTANIAIADCRFPNERASIKEWKGVAILVNGRETKQAADARAKAHASENSLGGEGDYDFVINNTGTLENLYSNLDAIMCDFLSFVYENKAS